MNPINIDYDKCTGCMACRNICPTGAIKIKINRKGFEYPDIDKNICINCGICDRICPITINKKEPKRITNNPIKVYAAKNKVENIREKSSSGGVFYEISELILDKMNGCVCGAVYDKDFEVKHIMTFKKEKRNYMQGSKYVQSQMGYLYKEIEEKLKNNRVVLFTGTPCEVDGVYNYLASKNIDTTNLYTCDIICHGVPSPGIYKQYLKKLEEKFSSKIKSINFRYKENNYTQNIKIEFENGKQYISNYFKGDELYNLFLKDYILRDSCYRCNYASTKRVADITIGDFWGIEKTIENFDDKKGVSLVLINTEKGKAIFGKVSDKFNLIESNIEDCMQNNLKKPCDIPQNYDELWKIYEKNGFLGICDYIKNL